MQYRYSPWWMPTVILGLIVLCVVLFSALVLQHFNLGAGINEGKSNTSGHSQKQYHWKMVTSWPKKFPGLGTAPENFAAMVNELSNGRLTIQVYGANEIVPAMGVFGAVSSGSVQMGHSAAYYWKGKIPAAPFFASVPFGMNAQELNGWFFHGDGMKLWRELYAPFNLIPFAGGNTGVQMGGWFNREINSLDDIKGLKMRIPGLGGEVITRAGGTAVNIPGGELYTSLQSGVIDATEWVGPYNDLASGFHEIAKYYYYPGWHEPGSAMEFMVNKTAYENLPEDLQKIIEIAARAINQDMLTEFTSANTGALVELMEKHHVNVKPFPDDVMKEFQRISFEMYDEMAAKDPTFARVYASYSDYQKKIKTYHEFSEQAYYNVR